MKKVFECVLKVVFKGHVKEINKGDLKVVYEGSWKMVKSWFNKGELQGDFKVIIGGKIYVKI